MRYPHGLAVWCLATAAVVVWPQSAAAGCTTTGELAQLADGLRTELRCSRLRFDNGAAVPCNVTPPPACAGGGAASVVELVSGAGAPAERAGRTARKQLRCQRALLSAATRYAKRRLTELGRGIRPTRSAGAFGAVQRACDGVEVLAVQGIALPTVGDACATSVGEPGATVDGAQVARCVRGTLEGLLGDLVAGRLAPNVVVVLTDDQNLASAASMDRVRAFGERAVRFTNAFATTPLCAPSRASLLTGLQADRHGITGNFLAAPTFDASSTVATWFDDAGYTTALFGKYMNFAHALTAVPPGWDEWQVLIGEDGGGNGYTDYRIDENGVLVSHGGPPREYSTDLLAGRVVSFLRKHVHEPLFVVFSPFAPHTPAIPARRHEGTLSQIAPWRPPNWREADISGKPSWVQFMKATWTPNVTLETDRFRIAQLESLRAVDEAFGRIESLLETLGIADNTVLVFTSDHGIHWGEHWWSSKFTAYEESIRVPLAIRYPVLQPQPLVRDELVLNIDLAPTLADLAGVTIPPDRDGTSAAALVRGEDVAWREDFAMRNWSPFIVPEWRGVRGERVKYVRLGSTTFAEELYDLENDPHELVNLVFDPAHASLLDQMRQRLVELHGD